MTTSFRKAAKKAPQKVRFTGTVLVSIPELGIVDQEVSTDFVLNTDLNYTGMDDLANQTVLSMGELMAQGKCTPEYKFILNQELPKLPKGAIESVAAPLANALSALTGPSQAELTVAASTEKEEASRAKTNIMNILGGNKA